MAMINLRDGEDYQQPNWLSANDQGITDPPVKSPDTTPNWLIPTNTDGSQVGGGTPWAAGSDHPSQDPAGFTWNSDWASYQPIPGYTTPTSTPTPAPSTPASQPATNWQIPTLPNGQQYGGASWAPGSDHPSQDPPGYKWDPTYASYMPIQGYAGTAATPAVGSDDYILSKIKQWATMPGADPSLANDPNYWLGAIKSKGGLSDANLQYWQDAAVGPSAFFRNPGREGGGATSQGYTTPAGGSYTSTNPFSDPATKNYIDLLNSRIQSLLTPQQNPQMDSLLQYLGTYFQQLQNPVYTDAQRGIIATQQLDPMERQRQARKQQVIQEMASRGMSPSDGPTVAALAQVDQQYDALRAQTQGGIANNEIQIGRQNQAQAVDVGSAAASLVNGINNQQDARANQAVSYGSQIPNIAQQRMAQAIQLLNGNNVNPASLVQSLQGFQQQGLNQNSQDSQAWSTIIAAFAKALGL